VQMNCTTSSNHHVAWEFLRKGSSSRITICSEGAVSRDVTHKYACKKLQTTHILTIRNVDFNDSGTYTCAEFDGRGSADSATLTVSCRYSKYVSINM